MGGNLLLLDEPTNDLDVETLQSLEDALLDFPGCAVVTSHDRWFLDRVATHILAWEGDDEDPARWFWFEGNYDAYEANKVERLGVEAARPHRVTHRRLTRPTERPGSPGWRGEGRSVWSTASSAGWPRPRRADRGHLQVRRRPGRLPGRHRHLLRPVRDLAVAAAGHLDPRVRSSRATPSCSSGCSTRRSASSRSSATSSGDPTGWRDRRLRWWSAASPLSTAPWDSARRCRTPPTSPGPIPRNSRPNPFLLRVRGLLIVAFGGLAVLGLTTASVLVSNTTLIAWFEALAAALARPGAERAGRPAACCAC